MSSISVTLIRNTHSDFNIDDIESLKVIRLNKQGIDLIDNLEVFSHIEELHLAGNVIRRIENIEFLSRLHLLDLSNNLITSESLNSSIGLLPQNIRTLILTGNPCTGDKYVLDAVQKSCDGLIIIANDTTEISNRLSELKIDALKIDSLKIVDYKGEYEGDVEDIPLNADEVLQSLVERKCRLQNMEVFDITKAVEVQLKN
jgi:Leucine-rich repeat (LRR) protein